MSMSERDDEERQAVHRELEAHLDAGTLTRRKLLELMARERAASEVAFVDWETRWLSAAHEAGIDLQPDLDRLSEVNAELERLKTKGSLDQPTYERLLGQAREAVGHRTDFLEGILMYGQLLGLR